MTSVITELLWLKVSCARARPIDQIRWLARSQGCKTSRPVTSAPGGGGTRPLATRSSSTRHKWSPVWVTNNYQWSRWFDLLWTFLWTFKRFLRYSVTLAFQWIQHLSLPLLKKLKNELRFVVIAPRKRPPVPSSWFVMIARSYLCESPGGLHLTVFTGCLGFERSSRRSALERLLLVTAFLKRPLLLLLLRSRTEKENEQIHSHVKGKTSSSTQTWRNQRISVLTALKNQRCLYVPWWTLEGWC